MHNLVLFCGKELRAASTCFIKTTPDSVFRPIRPLSSMYGIRMIANHACLQLCRGLFTCVVAAEVRRERRGAT